MSTSSQSLTQPVSAFYGTNLHNVVTSYSRLADRITYTLGYPLVNIEIHRNQLYEFIAIAAEMFTKYAGYTQEFLIFDSTLYENGKGIRLDKLFSLTPELKNSYTTVDLTLAEADSRTTTVTHTANTSAVAYHFFINGDVNPPTEFGIRYKSSNDNHQRVSKMLVTTSFSRNDDELAKSGSASFTEYGVINTASTDLATFTVSTSGVSGERVNIIAEPTVDGSSIVVATDIFNSSLSALEAQQSGLRSYDTLINNYRQVMDVINFDEGSNQGVNTLFTIEQTLAQQTYFSYSMGNYGFDLISWYTVKEFLETREKMLTTKRSYKFDPHTQYLTMYPQPLSGAARFYGIVSCYLERPLAEVIREQWVYQYSLALTKIGVANIRGKFSGTNLLGGGTLNYSDLQSQGLQEKEKLEQQLFEGVPGFGDTDPPMFFVG